MFIEKIGRGSSACVTIGFELLYSLITGKET